MPYPFWPLLAATALVMTGACLFVVHSLSRRLKKLERNLRRDLARDGKAGISKLSRLSLDFDRERGWQIYDFGDVRFLVVRPENLGALPQALGTFYDLPPQRIHVLNSNIGDAKGEHGSRYRNFRPRAKIPAELLDLAYSSRFAKHFYSAAELEEFRSRWSSAA